MNNKVRFYKIRAGRYETSPTPAAGVLSIELIDDIGPRHFWNVAEYVVSEYDGGLDLCGLDHVDKFADAKDYVRSLLAANEKGANL